MKTPDPAAEEERLRAGRIGLGCRIRDWREHADLGLADAATRAGISYSYLSDVERGRRSPSLEVLVAIAKVLDTTVVALLDGVYPYGTDTLAPDIAPPPDGRRRARPA